MILPIQELLVQVTSAHITAIAQPK